MFGSMDERFAPDSLLTVRREFRNLEGWGLYFKELEGRGGLSGDDPLQKW
jgi:hypothetical protein